MKLNTDKVREDIRRVGLLVFAVGLFSLLLDAGSPLASIGLALVGLLAVFAGNLEKR